MLYKPLRQYKGQFRPKSDKNTPLMRNKKLQNSNDDLEIPIRHKIIYHTQL
jgi:hypothetical protein